MSSEGPSRPGPSLAGSFLLTGGGGRACTWRTVLPGRPHETRSHEVRGHTSSVWTGPRLSGLSGVRRLVLRSLVSTGAGAKGIGQEAACVLGRCRTLGSVTTRVRAGLGTTGGPAPTCAPH